MKTSLLSAILLLVAACSSAPKTSQTEQPGGGPSPGGDTTAGGDTTDPAPPDGPGRGEPCADGACAAGLECVTYYGIAGAQGPTFTSCETRCGDDPAVCPEGTTCQTIADGPGAVCR